MLAFELYTGNNLDLLVQPGGLNVHDFHKQSEMRTHQTPAHSFIFQQHVASRYYEKFPVVESSSTGQVKIKPLSLIRKEQI